MQRGAHLMRWLHVMQPYCMMHLYDCGIERHVILLRLPPFFRCAVGVCHTCAHVELGSCVGTVCGVGLARLFALCEPAICSGASSSTVCTSAVHDLSIYTNLSNAVSRHWDKGVALVLILTPPLQQLHAGMALGNGRTISHGASGVSCLCLHMCYCHLHFSSGGKLNTT